MPGLGRLGDLSHVAMDNHGCPACPHVCTGPAIVASPNVNVNNIPALRIGDKGVHAACCGPNQWTAQGGSSSVFINNMGVHRQGDVDVHCGGIGRLIMGSPNVNAGG